MLITKLVLATTAVAALTVGAGMLMASPALAGTAPACIVRKIHPNLHYADITNKCGKTMRVAVRVRFGPDLCYELPNQLTRRYYFPVGKYRKTSTPC